MRGGRRCSIDRVLVVDDEFTTRRLLASRLEAEGFSVATASSGREAIEAVRRQKYDAVALDLILPDLDGLEVCREIRDFSQVPVLVISTRATLDDRLSGLETGADDYLVKPFDLPEVVARIRALIRRARGVPIEPAEREVRVGRLTIQPESRMVLVEGRSLALTRREFDLLLLLADRMGKPVQKAFILDTIWGDSELESDKILAVYIRRLRRKIERNPDEPEQLLTIRGIGYSLGVGTGS